MMRNVAFILYLVIAFCFPGPGTNAFAGNEPGDKPWLVYYSDKAPLTSFQPYGLVVLDSKYHPPLPPLSDRGKVLLGYLSVGEVESHRDHFAEVKSQGLLLEENRNWKDSFFVDVRDPRWTQLVIEELVPAILRQGFDGLFLDTLDNPIYLEQREPERYAGMQAASAQLVRSIKRHYPNAKIMVNRAYKILPEIAPYLYAVLGESIFSDFDFDKKSYQLVERKAYEQQVSLLKALGRDFPNVQIMTLDYWDPKDSYVIKGIYDEQRRNGFKPYVATIKLDTIVAEPNR